MTKMKKIYKPYGSLSTWEIKHARSHAKMYGPGIIPEIKTKHRVRLDMGKVDHFVEFINGPYFYQDVSHGNKVLTLDNGDRIEMPNVKHIMLWKAHIVCSINQEEAKQDALKSEDPQAAILIMDWAMKFLQIKFREKRSKWFGKRGLSWHISTCITKNVDSGKIELKSYAHILDSCQQDWYAVCSIIEDTLEVVKKEHPQITQVNLRSDEAGCYHNTFHLAAVRDAGRRVGIELARYDFSEPQYGKDICDRILCPMKASIRRYCNEGHDVVSAKDMRVALSERPVQGTTASVCAMNETQKTLEVHKIEGFSKYHNFKFEVEGIRAWRAYGVGLGRFIPY
ncbi:unnamed protein product [Porites lobata]|uniref:Uncharacterized protein n=1 Tax=Porites lobata TaxID=104759 RepID=A0ABN8NZF6_9CNID|nr:unnamed protein product [Porites lobata]